MPSQCPPRSALAVSLVTTYKARWQSQVPLLMVPNSTHDTHEMRPSKQRRTWIALVSTLVFIWFALIVSMHGVFTSRSTEDFEPRPPVLIQNQDGQGGGRSPQPQVHALQRVASPQSTDHVVKGLTKATHLIMVAGHTIFQGTDYAEPGVQTKDWVLLDYQSKQLDSYLQHIRVAVDLAANDEESLVLFSGGATRETAGPRSEAMSYWLYADAQHWFGHNGTSEQDSHIAVKDRVHTEEFARDSFQNLLFSVCRFRQLTLSYPARITVVRCLLVAKSHGLTRSVKRHSLPFKENRFRNLHRQALRYPADRFSFVGVGDSTPEAVTGEQRNSVVPFTSDPYGCHGSLEAKRRGRNPWNVATPYPKGCEELAGLFEYCGDGFYQGPLPWDASR